MRARGLDFTVHLGDMVSRGTTRRFLRFFETLSECAAASPYLTVLGNHDRRAPHGETDSRLYRSLFGKTNYRFDRGLARFVMLDTSRRRLTRRQLVWLDAALRTGQRKLVFTHVPPADFGEWAGLGGFREGAREFLSILRARRADRAFFGHIHAFDVREHQGVRFILTGGGGSPLFPVGGRERFYHYIVVEVGPEGLRETVRFADGRRLDL
jgi:3',5'-cyclic AMP phosphodiesterase CpdA